MTCCLKILFLHLAKSNEADPLNLVKLSEILM